MSGDYWDRWWALVCSFEQALRVLFTVVVILLVLVVLSFFNVEPGTGTYLVVLADLAILTPALIAITVLLWKCNSR